MHSVKLAPLHVERLAKQGEYVEAKKFDLELSKRVAELEREYGVHYDPSTPVPSDPSLGKAVFEAGLELAAEKGLLVVDESRAMRFTHEELLAALREAPRELVLGSGRDARVLRARRAGDSARPFVFGGLAGTPVPQEYFYLSALSYAVQPLVDAVDHGSIQEVWGVRVRGGAPSEAVAGVEELRLLRKALEDAGRPGMHLLAAESSVTSTASLAAMSLGLLRRGDAQLLPVLNELKTDYHQLTKAAVGLMAGVHGAALVDPIVGGFARGPAGSAIVSVAETLLALAAYGASYVLLHPVHITRQATSTAECMWVQVAVGLANEQMNLPLVADVWPSNGAGSAEYLYEIAANTVAAVAAGLHLLGPVPANGTKPNGGGAEAQFMAELGEAVARRGLSLQDANEVVKDLYKLYSDRIGAKPGKPFWEVYDLRTLDPSTEWREAIDGVKKELADRGLL
uniref:[methylamine--corrinoid protein] Co-methyltransferase n=1 Tax=Thermofilum pendens TaxID=2269 RepID=A0A7J3X8E3_THEPE